MVSELARQDDYGYSDLGIPIGAPQTGGNLLGGLASSIGSQGEYMIGKDVDTLRSLGKGMGDILTLPQRAIQNSQFSLDTGTYDPAVPVEAALTTMGGGVAGTGAKMGETALTAGYDPKLWHGVSQIKLPKPIDEMSSVLRPINPAPETVISPARLQNSMLMPLLGDRSAAAAELARVNGFPFENPVALQGGHGYMANAPDMVWAAGKSVAPGIAKVVREGAETGLPVHGVYTAMGERSVDFSHMMSDTLAEMAKHTKITPEGAQIFNDTMKKIAPDFPGVLDPNVAAYLRSAPGELRNVFAKTMDTSKMQKYGFPSVAEARVAITDPRLLNEPTGASGLSIARMDPKGTLGPSGHITYDTGIAGDYVAGLPASVPKEIMWPDIVGPLSAHADAVAAARVAAGKTPFRPTEDYLMGRTPVGLPKLQEANQQWVDAMSKHLEDRGFTLGAGATDKTGAAAIQGIRAYHGSPHDFEKFDLSKIGTGEGAQAYGHGLYFAGNENVARGYRDALAGMNKSTIPPAYLNLASDLKTGGASPDEVFATLQRAYKGVDPVMLRNAADYIAPKGHMYEVNINADPAQMLDWDKPLAQQQQVHEALINAARDPAYERLREAQWKQPNWANGDPNLTRYVDNISAGTKYIATGANIGSASKLSAALQEQGIPGIKYLDAGSRGPVARIQTLEERIAREQAQGLPYDHWQTELDQLKAQPPSSNYVVFNPSIIDILRKYGIAGAAPAGLGALAAQDQYRNP